MGELENLLGPSVHYPHMALRIVRIDADGVWLSKFVIPLIPRLEELSIAINDDHNVLPHRAGNWLAILIHYGPSGHTCPRSLCPAGIHPLRPAPRPVWVVRILLIYPLRGYQTVLKDVDSVRRFNVDGSDSAPFETFFDG